MLIPLTFDITRKNRTNRNRLRSFEQEKTRYGVLNQRPVGVKPIEIEKIVGSVGRWKDFDARFRWKHGEKDQRTKAIEHALERGEVLPPIEVYELDGRYYVVDGHHRVNAAKSYGLAFIDANVTKLIPDSRRVS